MWSSLSSGLGLDQISESVSAYTTPLKDTASALANSAVDLLDAADQEAANMLNGEYEYEEDEDELEEEGEGVTDGKKQVSANSEKVPSNVAEEPVSMSPRHYYKEENKALKDMMKNVLKENEEMKAQLEAATSQTSPPPPEEGSSLNTEDLAPVESPDLERVKEDLASKIKLAHVLESDLNAANETIASQRKEMHKLEEKQKKSLERAKRVKEDVAAVQRLNQKKVERKETALQKKIEDLEAALASASSSPPPPTEHTGKEIKEMMIKAENTISELRVEISVLKDKHTEISREKEDAEKQMQLLGKQAAEKAETVLISHNKKVKGLLEENQKCLEELKRSRAANESLSNGHDSKQQELIAAHKKEIDGLTAKQQEAQKKADSASKKMADKLQAANEEKLYLEKQVEAVKKSASKGNLTAEKLQEAHKVAIEKIKSKHKKLTESSKAKLKKLKEELIAAHKAEVESLKQGHKEVVEISISKKVTDHAEELKALKDEHEQVISTHISTRETLEKEIEAVKFAVNLTAKNLQEEHRVNVQEIIQRHKKSMAFHESELKKLKDDLSIAEKSAKKVKEERDLVEAELQKCLQNVGNSAAEVDNLKSHHESALKQLLGDHASVLKEKEEKLTKVNAIALHHKKSLDKLINNSEALEAENEKLQNGIASLKEDHKNQLAQMKDKTKELKEKLSWTEQKSSLDGDLVASLKEEHEKNMKTITDEFKLTLQESEEKMKRAQAIALHHKKMLDEEAEKSAKADTLAAEHNAVLSKVQMEKKDIAAKHKRELERIRAEANALQSNYSSKEKELLISHEKEIKILKASLETKSQSNVRLETETMQREHERELKAEREKYSLLVEEFNRAKQSTDSNNSSLESLKKEHYIAVKKMETEHRRKIIAFEAKLKRVSEQRHKDAVDATTVSNEASVMSKRRSKAELLRVNVDIESGMPLADDDPMAKNKHDQRSIVNEMLMASGHLSRKNKQFVGTYMVILHCLFLYLLFTHGHAPEGDGIVQNGKI